MSGVWGSKSSVQVIRGRSQKQLFLLRVLMLFFALKKIMEIVLTWKKFARRFKRNYVYNIYNNNYY